MLFNTRHLFPKQHSVKGLFMFSYRFSSEGFGLRFDGQCFLRLLGTVLLVATGFVPAAQAGVKFWTGTVNDNFSNGGNWIGGTPVTGDDLIFQTTATQLLVTNDFSPNRASSAPAASI
jgi:hypothetical protein